MRKKLIQLFCIVFIIVAICIGFINKDTFEIKKELDGECITYKITTNEDDIDAIITKLKVETDNEYKRFNLAYLYVNEKLIGCLY